MRMSDGRILVLGLIFGVALQAVAVIGVPVLSAETPKPDAPKASAPDLSASLRSALAQRTQQLGACNAELGPLQELSSQVLTGQVGDVAAAKAQQLAADRAAFLKAHPGLQLADDWTTSDAKETNAK